MPALGQRFRAAREARGLTLPEVAEQVRIRSVYLKAIEDEDWSAIGASVYIRGFLRTYARFLGLDAEATVAEFNLGEGERAAIVRARGDIADVDRPGGSRRLQLSPLIWIASLVAILLVAFVVYNELTLPKAPAPIGFASTPSPSVTASASPTAVALASPATVPSGGSDLVLRLTGLSWVRVTVDGTVVAEGMLSAGAAKAFSGRKVTVLVGNAGAVDLTVGGVDKGKMGADGQVVEQTFTFPAVSNG